MPDAAVAAAPAAEAPLGPGSRVLALCADDGVRLRAALLEASAGGRGLALLLQGRTEFIEKYAPVAARLHERGLSVATLDWRGQGGSERPVDHPRKGHVDDFAAYQRDLDALLRTLPEAFSQTGPSTGSGARIVLAHSMGGAIALRALSDPAARARRFGTGLAGAVFSAPMWGLAQSAAVAWLGRSLARGACALGLARSYAPGGGDRAYVLGAAPGRNVLTSDAAQFARMQALARERPDLALGGPTWGWVRAAYGEMDALRAAPLDLAHLTVAGSAEAVTSLRAMRARSGPHLRLLEGARHEPLFEAPAAQARFWGELDGFLARIGV